MHLVQIILKLLKSQSVALLVSTVFSPILLQTLIGQVNLIVLFLGVVLLTWCAQIALLVVVNLEVFSQKYPNTDVELSVVIQQWFFYVLLDHPKWVFEFKNVVRNIFCISENFDTTTLILSCWFNNPHIFSAVFQRYFLITRASWAQFSESLQKHVNLSIVACSRNNISRGCCIKACVTFSYGFLIRIVVILERFD